MNTTQDDGGPAFPIPTLQREYWDCEQGEPNGMSLRDWFAGMALQGINAAPMNRFPELKNETDTAIAAYMMADAMLAVRKEGQ